jgi:hypothetical protein
MNPELNRMILWRAQSAFKGRVAVASSRRKIRVHGTAAASECTIVGPRDSRSSHRQFL